MSNNLFGNKGGLFGANNQPNNNQGGFSFGANNNQSNNQGNSLFGANNNQNNQGGLFGANNNQNNNQGNLFGANNQNQNNNNLGGLFTNNQNNNNSILSGGLFSSNNNQNNNNNQNPFGGINNNQQNNNNNFSINNMPNFSQTAMFTSVNPILSLNRNNSLRNLELFKLPEEYQNAVITLKTQLKNQELKLDELQKYSQRIIDLIDESNKSVEKMGEFNDFINKKLDNYETILNQINEKFNFLSDSFDQEQKNISLMEQDLGFKIEIPSKFLLEYSQNLYNKTITFNEKLNDIVGLIKVYCSQANGDIDFDAGILESTLAEFIKIVKDLLIENERQEKMINELYHLIFEFAVAYGEDPENVRNNIIQNSLERNNTK